MSIKMIGLDLDGTALDPKGHFSDRVREAFAAAMQQGIHIVIATGRPPVGAAEGDLADRGPGVRDDRQRKPDHQDC